MFKHNYLIFDEFGIRTVLCMSCAKPIKTRQEIISKLNPKVIIRELSKHADYREIPVMLSGNRIAFVMICDECKINPISEEEIKDISIQIRDAFRMQLEFDGKPSDLISESIEEGNYKVLRKANVSEVVTALRGVYK